MALLNYTSEYSKINQYLNAVSGSSDWLKISVSPDASGGGHFITHGIDFSANYAAGKRGLVPSNTAADLTKTFLEEMVGNLFGIQQMKLLLLLAILQLRNQQQKKLIYKALLLAFMILNSGFSSRLLLMML